MSASEPVYFGDARRIAGWYHAAVSTTRRDCAVVFCGPLGYEELCAHRALRHWADAFASAGVASLRFDYDGCGNSAGSDRDPHRVAAWIANIGDAVAFVRARTGVTHVVLVGVRLGGTLAIAAAEHVGADSLILFGAPASGRAYAREIRAFGRLMRTDPAGEAAGPANDSVEQVAGFVITRETMSELASLDPLARRVPVRQALVIPRDDVAADATVADRLTAYGVHVERAALPGYATMMVDAHESVPPRAVIEACTEWLVSMYGECTTAVPSATISMHGEHDAAGPVEGNVAESSVVFDAKKRLFGVLSEPASACDRNGTSIVLVNAGSVHTVGPGRLYVALARTWAALGFSVLRVDLGGVGDSDGRGGSADNHPYPNHAVEDIATTARWVRERVHATRVVAAGLCSGAHASFHAGLNVDGIDGVIVINPIVFYWTPECALDVSAWMNYYESQRYSKSARQLGSWMRLIRGKVNVRYAAGVVARRATEVAVGAGEAVWRRLGLNGQHAEDVARDLGRIAERGKNVLLLFSEGDPGLDFVRRRFARGIEMLGRKQPRFAMQVIPNADHTFTRFDARERLGEILSAYLVDRYRR